MAKIAWPILLSITAALLGLLADDEGRAFTVFIVDSEQDHADSNTGDGLCVDVVDGLCTLRAAIQQANATAGADFIDFAIGDPPPVPTNIPTISVGSSGNGPLPAITEQVTIDGTTDPFPPVEIEGLQAGANADGLAITGGSGTVIRGLAINRFTRHGIRIAANGQIIEGNRIGTGRTGTTDQGNGADGVRIEVGGSTIGGTTAAQRNVISGNQAFGVRISVTLAASTVQGNFIGTNNAGTADLGNSGSGIFLETTNNNIIGGASGTTPGGACTGACNLISGNDEHGMMINAGIANASNNVIQGNHIGTNANGDADLGNSQHGIWIFRADNNVIGGTAAGAGNVISGNGNQPATIGYGVLIQEEAQGNRLEGNRIGTNSAGTAAVPNNYGVFLDSIANNAQHNLTGNVIGGSTGSTPGGACTGACNVISGNSPWDGVYMCCNMASGNLVRGNHVGLNAAGTAAVTNNRYGVLLVYAANNEIGGMGTGEGNVISGNGVYGVALTGGNPPADANKVRGNRIGTNSAGTAAIGQLGGVSLQTAINSEISGNVISASFGAAPTFGNGILIDSGSSSNNVLNNLIGTNAAGTAALGNAFNGVFINGGTGNNIGNFTGGGNVISGNANGVEIGGATAQGNTVRGNRIGTDVNGTADVGNTNQGVLIRDGADTNHIGSPNNSSPGGACTGGCNLISGNNQQGVYLLGPGVENNEVHSNFIGTTASGTAGLGNTGYGVLIDSANNSKIGSTNNSGNVIASNGLDGIGMFGANGTTVYGNKIGVNTSGGGALGNGRHGIFVSGGSQNTIGSGIGASPAGPCQGGCNLISANAAHGIALSVASLTNVQGNFIGTDAAGTSDLGNSQHGISANQSGSNTIGGNNAQQRNVISGNNQHGIFFDNTGSTSNRIEGNHIGVNAPGNGVLGNGFSGAVLQNAPSNTIGGLTSTPGAAPGNVISGNPQHGVVIFGDGADSNTVQGNIVGLNLAGNADFGNGDVGVWVLNSADNNTIGGTAPGARNVASGNARGIAIFDSGTTGNNVQGNYAGTDITGNIAIGNTVEGVGVSYGASSNTVGGGTAAARNVLSGNGQNGVRIGEGGASNNNLVQGNFIGTNAAGTAGMANGSHGVLVTGDSTQNTIGGGAVGQSNVIAFNGGHGVNINGIGTVGNTITANSIHSNSQKGIGLTNGGNGMLTPPTVTTLGSASGTACALCLVQVYSDSVDEGRLFHGTATADVAGNWSYAGPVTGPNVTATASQSGSTSEFSAPLGCLGGSDTDSDTICNSGDNCPSIANTDQTDFDADALGDACDPEDDGDGFTDLVEFGAPLCGANVNHDGPPPPTNPMNDDALVNDGCPAIGAAEANCVDTVDNDGDGAFNDGCPQVGAFSEAQFRIGTGSLDPCGNNGWPLDLVSTPASTANRYNISDLASFVTGVRKLGKNPNQAGFDSRWDLEPGNSGLTSSGWINIVDLGKTTGGASGFPPMLGGARALNQLCPFPP